MNHITSEIFKQAVADFLNAQYIKKAQPDIKKLEKAEQAGEQEQVHQLQISLNETSQKYELNTWMSKAATQMAKQLYFGTHISKGVHPDAKGDNVVFDSKHAINESYIGSHTIQTLQMDANGNAAALPLAAFFAWPVDEKANIKIADLIVDNHPATHGAYADQKELSNQYAEMFQQALKGSKEKFTTHERNKQILWPVCTSGNSEESDLYHCLVPLYPSSLAFHFNGVIKNLRYSEENKKARKNRNKVSAEQKPYLSINDLAVIQLGGTKPQNISKLASHLSGRVSLLPSIPPNFDRSKALLLPKKSTSFFSNKLAYRCRYEIESLVEISNASVNNVDVRMARKNTLDNILHQVVKFASEIQDQYQPGWSKEYRELDNQERLWLDPNRIHLSGEEEFRNDRTKGEWISVIEDKFAGWINKLLKQHIPEKKFEFADAEYLEWKRECSEMIKLTQREGMGVFV